MIINYFPPSLIIGLIISFIAIGVLFYFNRQLKRKLEGTNKALLALQQEFTQYQVNEKRYWEKERAKEEIRHDNIAKCITKNEQLISAINQRIPDEIKKCIKHIELAK